MTRHPRAVPLVTIGRLARRLAVYEWTLARALHAAGVPLARQDSRGSWVDSTRATRVLKKLDQEELKAASKRDRLGVRTSKLWVAGYPDLVAEWHPRNDDLFPDEVRHRSNRRVWWRCPKGPDHEWQARAQSRTLGAGCPFCTHRKVSITNSLATLQPKLAREWHPTRNGKQTPATTLAGSVKKVWWRCPKGPDHEWPCAPVHRQGCPFCAGHLVSVTNSLKTLAPQVAAEFHPTKNGRLTAESVTKGSSKSVWWRCRVDPGHAWRATVADRTGRHPTGCPHCAELARRERDSLARRRPNLLELWDHKRNTVPPSEVPARAKVLVWWRCPQAPDHRWQAAPIHVGPCPFCSNRRASTTNSLASRFPAIAREWHPTRNGKQRPELLVAGSGAAAWWRCARDPRHVWQARVVARTSGGHGCPHCFSKLKRGRYPRP